MRVVNTRLVTYDIKIERQVSDWCKTIVKPASIELQVLVANMVGAVKKDCILVYSRNKNESATSNRKISVRKLINAVDLLCELGYATTIIGVASKIVENRVPSTLTPTKEFIDMWSQDIVEKHDVLYISSIDKIEIRDITGKSTKIRRTKQVREIEYFVDRLNVLNNQHDVLNSEGLLMSNIYCRIFNVDLNHGGRFYRAEILEIDNKDSARLDITIDGESVVEVDYSGLHIRIAAAEAGVLEAMPDDPYSLVDSDVSERRLIKKSVNIMLNCRSRKSAIGAINNELKNTTSKYKSATELVDKITHTFAFVGNIFCCEDSKGLYYQARDSELAAHVMELFVEMQVPILPIHDGFITKARFAEVLYMRMGVSFRELFDCDLLVPVTMSYRGEDGKVIKENLRV